MSKTVSVSAEFEFEAPDNILTESLRKLAQDKNFLEGVQASIEEAVEYLGPETSLYSLAEEAAGSNCEIEDALIESFLKNISGKIKESMPNVTVSDVHFSIIDLTEDYWGEIVEWYEQTFATEFQKCIAEHKRQQTDNPTVVDRLITDLPPLTKDQKRELSRKILMR